MMRDAVDWSPNTDRNRVNWPHASAWLRSCEVDGSLFADLWVKCDNKTKLLRSSLVNCNFAVGGGSAEVMKLKVLYFKMQVLTGYDKVCYTCVFMYTSVQ